MNEPDIIVSTPVAFLNNIDPKKNHRLDFIRCVKYVVCFLILDFIFSLVIPESLCLIFFIYNKLTGF